MIKKEVEFTNYNGDTVKQSFYFDLSEAEVSELQVEHNGRLTEYLQKIVDAQDSKEIVRYFKKLMILAYGEKSQDGNYFIKDEETKRHLIYSPAYSKIFMELATDDEAGAAFVQGILPPDLEKRAEELRKKEEQKKLTVVE